MADSEAWRRERVEQLFGHKAFGGPSRPLPATGLARDSPDDVLPMRLPPVRQASPSPAIDPLPKPRPEQPRAAPAAQPAYTRTISPPVLAGTIVLAVLAAALLGWFAGRSSLPAVPLTVVTPPVVALPPRAAPLPPATIPPPVVEADRALAVREPAPAAPIVEAAQRPAAVPQARVAIDRPAAAPKPSVTAPRSVDRLRFASPTPLAGRKFSPSFNCRRATALSNRLICDDPALAALDNRMASAFRARIAGIDLPTARAIDAEQTSFLNERIACTTRDCIERVYRNRLAQLAVR